MKISDKVKALSERAVLDISEQFKKIDEIAEVNTEKVLDSFHRHRVSDGCFAGTTGYGYNDKGRDTLDRIYADIMGAPSALVRTGFVNGTHAITCALFAVVRPGQTLLSVSGLPYDTIRGTIGITGEYRGSLKDYGVRYSQLELNGDGSPDHEAITRVIREENVGAVLVQRSRGYSARRALTVKEIGEICDTVRGVDKGVNVFVDNCYGEFVEIAEPGDVGADLMAGSLIKNPGGGIAPMGGYVAGREDLVEAAAFRLTTPGIGGECGATLDVNRL
ncbi:MAG: methionine gamma-lyase family protein, partial [Oscillospiraceae bacterium]|nr:methionine gamma-lyase family protein [Oscillospiraceae bacterium]